MTLSILLRRRLKLLVAVAVAVLAAGAGVAVGVLREAPQDARYNGAYRLDDGQLVFIHPRQGPILRYRMLSGESRSLFPAGKRSYESGPGFKDRSPVDLRLTFDVGGEGAPGGFTWTRGGGSPARATRLALPETRFRFESGGIALRGLLVEPAGAGPHPAVVIVQGSEENGAVDGYDEPYLFASMGIAAVVFDKRGTGGSRGRYTQNFHTLARDVGAAVAWLRSRPEIDGERIHLSGYSQGGWVAPLAAATAGGGRIRSLLINYGPAVPVIAEDRWGYVHSLREHGFGEDAIRDVDRINDTVARILDHREDRYPQLGEQLAAARAAPWFGALEKSDSALGFILASGMPLWTVRLYSWWKMEAFRDEPFIDRLYDPVPTLASLPNTPSLWIFGGRDRSMPTEWSLEKLERLRRQGIPIETKVFADADHGILRIEPGPGGERRIAGYEPGYLMAQVNWIRRQSGLAPLPGGP